MTRNAIPHPISVKRLFDIVNYLVDERVGIIRNVVEVPREAGAPNLFCFYARACNTKVFTDQVNFANAAGASLERHLAVAKAIGEAVERYCAAIYDRQDLPFYSWDDAPFDCISPNKFALYSGEQYSQEDFPYRPFTKETKARWTAATDLATSQTYHVPAAMVFLPYTYDQGNGEQRIVQPISTGLACHCSKAEATISGICEVIERDAFTITWQARLGMPQIDTETLSDANRDLVCRFEQTGAVVHLLDLTMDHGVPTILAVLRHDAPEMPALVVAAAAHLSSEQAVRKSLEELELTRRLGQGLKAQLSALIPEAEFKNIVTQDDHIHLFCDHANIHLAEFLTASEARVRFTDLPNLLVSDPEIDLQILVDRINSVGHQVIVADLTTSDIDTLGLAVIRAIIPGFHPLVFGHYLRAMGGTRLWQVPQKLGYVGVTQDTSDNPIPHPYP